MLFGDIALRYLMNQVRVEKFNVLHELAAHDPSFCQINTEKLFVCGGIQRGTKHTVSSQAAIFDFEVQSFSNLPSMEVAKYHHSCTVVENMIYVFGGGTNGSVDSNTVERYSFKYQKWGP